MIPHDTTTVGSSRTVKDTLLRLSRERIQEAKLAASHPTIESDVVAEIAGLDSTP